MQTDHSPSDTCRYDTCTRTIRNTPSAASFQCRNPKIWKYTRECHELKTFTRIFDVFHLVADRKRCTVQSVVAHEYTGRKYYYESAEIDTKKQGVKIAEFISRLPFTPLFVNSLFNFATLWAMRPRSRSGQCDVKGRSHINITQKSYFWTTHAPNVTLYNISLTQIETTPRPEKWPNRKLALVTVTVAVRVNTAGGCEISFIPLRLGAVIPVNCWKIDAESLANAR